MRALAGKKIGVFGKGGSGKSTTVVLLARALKSRGYAACVLDADSTNVGLHRALGLAESPVPLLTYFGGMVFRGGRVTCPVDDPLPLQGADTSFAGLPPQYHAETPDGVGFLVAGKLGDEGPGAGCDGPIAKIARDLTIRSDREPPVLLVDFKAGVEDFARGVITNLDWMMVVVDPTGAALQIAVHMRDMVSQLKAGARPATQHLESPELVDLVDRMFREARVRGVLVVLNRIKDAETERYLRRQLGEAGITPVGVIHEDPLIAGCWLERAPLRAAMAAADALGIVDRLEEVDAGVVTPAA
jgi:CO dehydrogenase maturation factor